jgi:hypothetical protein
MFGTKPERRDVHDEARNPFVPKERLQPHPKRTAICAASTNPNKPKPRRK